MVPKRADYTQLNFNVGATEYIFCISARCPLDRFLHLVVHQHAGYGTNANSTYMELFGFETSLITFTNIHYVH